MELPSQYQSLLDEYCQSLGIDALTPDQYGAVYLQFNEKLSVGIQLDLQHEGILYFSYYEIPEGVDCTHIYKSALEGNFLWLQTGEATLSLDGVKGELALMKRLPFGSVQDLSTFRSSLYEFVNIAHEWQQKIAHPEPRATDRKTTEGACPDPAIPHSWERV